MRRSIASGLLAVLFGLGSAASLAESISAENVPESRLISGREVANMYPLAFGNVDGKNSTLYITTLSPTGNYLICSGDPQELNCGNVSLETGITAIDVSEIGLEGRTGMIVAQAADDNTFAVSVLMVENQASGIDFIDPVLIEPFPVDGDTPQPSSEAEPSPAPGFPAP